MEIEYSTPKKYQNFFNKIFKKTVLEENKELQEKQKIDSKMDFLIQNKNFTSLSIFIKKNVSFSHSQVEKILISDNFFISQDRKIVEQFISNNQNTIHKVLDEKQNTIHKVLDGKVSYRDFNFNAIIELANWMEIFSKEVFDNQNDTLEKTYKNFCEMYNSISNISYNNSVTAREIFENFNKIIKNKAIEPLQEMHDKVFREEIESLANRAKILEVSSMGDMISQINHIQINNFSVSQLPEESRNLFEQIKQVAITIESQKSLLDTSKSLDFENLFWKRVPQVLKEYISIPETYRADLAKLDNNPDTLLKSSLTEIFLSLNTLTDALKISHLDGMKKTNNYLKSHSI